ncbi:MAG: hypothetical protein EPO35_11595 [Acidobacteria bacterium]|nr:MAG: hypothetical protein EPO35_11595 [Acidobacteriota bacterium]
MWPFSKKSDVRGLKVPTQPSISVGELRQAYTRGVQGSITFDGPFPLLTQQGVFLCKSCGAAFDNWNLATALNGLREALLNPASDITMFIVNCRKCMTFVVFSAKDVITNHPGDSTGPWTPQELDMAELSLTMLLKLSPAEAARIDPAHLQKVFYIYR